MRNVRQQNNNHNENNEAASIAKRMASLTLATPRIYYWVHLRNRRKKLLKYSKRIYDQKEWASVVSIRNSRVALFLQLEEK